MFKLIRKIFFDRFSQYEKEYGYIKLRNGYCRVYNNIVQGFELFKEPRSPLITIRWAVYPLCQPDANFYRDFYQSYDINDIVNEKNLDIFYEKQNKDSIVKCAETLYQKIDTILLPFFNGMHRTEEAYSACKQLDLKSGDDFPTDEKIFFCLKLKSYDLALGYVNKLIENNEMAYKMNAQYFTEKEMKEMRETRKDRDCALQELANFIQNHDEKSMQNMLETNEKNAMRFFEQKCQKGKGRYARG